MTLPEFPVSSYLFTHLLSLPCMQIREELGKHLLRDPLPSLGSGGMADCSQTTYLMLSERHSASCRLGFLPGLAVSSLQPINGSGPKDHTWKITQLDKVCPSRLHSSSLCSVWQHSGPFMDPFLYPFVLKLVPTAVPNHSLLFPTPLLRLTHPNPFTPQITRGSPQPVV